MTALVTGSSRGIGRGIILALAELGHDVAVHYNHSAEAAEATRREAASLGVRAVAVQGDLTDMETAARVVGDAHSLLGDLEVLVNNVGNYVYTPLDKLGFDQWRDVLASNLDATFATCQTAVPILRARGGGRIVNVGYAGSANVVARPNLVAYAIAKTGVVQLTRSLARSEAANGITANVVAPGVMENSVTMPVAEIPAGRVGRIDELAAAVRYLVSDEAAYVTGQVIEVAGGWNL